MSVERPPTMPGAWCPIHLPTADLSAFRSNDPPTVRPDMWLRVDGGPLTIDGEVVVDRDCYVPYNWAVEAGVLPSRFQRVEHFSTHEAMLRAEQESEARFRRGEIIRESPEHASVVVEFPHGTVELTIDLSPAASKDPPAQVIHEAVRQATALLIRDCRRCSS